MTSPPIRGRRGKCLLNEEDVALCISWMTITQDPVIGIGQPMSKFWDRVMAKFLETNVGVDPPQTLCSVQNRWDRIRHYCKSEHHRRGQLSIVIIFYNKYFNENFIYF